VVRFYDVNYDLAISSFERLPQVRHGDLVVLIDYFGISLDPAFAVQARERGAWVLEDARQTMLAGQVVRFSDFLVCSPRKYLGVPDGGIRCVNYEVDFQGVHLETPPPAEWWLDAFLASLLRGECDIHGGSRPWFGLFQKTEHSSPIGPFAMSELSGVLLRSSFDYGTIARRRVENYRALVASLSNLALFPHLSDQAVRLGFPIHSKQREEVRQALFAGEVYPPVHWPVPATVPQEHDESRRLASEILTLPCDQGYDVDDMERMAQLVAKALEC
jgi:hypothetical protein